MKLQRLVVDVRGAVEGYLAALTDVQTAKEAYTRACRALTDEDAAVKNRYDAMQYRKPCHYDERWFEEYSIERDCAYPESDYEGAITQRGGPQCARFPYVAYYAHTDPNFCWLGHP